MARKTDGTTTTSRKKKTNPPAETVAAQPAAEQVTPEVKGAEVRIPEARSEVRIEVRRNVTPINVAPAKTASRKPGHGNLDIRNLDEEIRRRAYELFLERNGAAGDPNADWLIAEREIRARFAGKDAALAATQGRS